MVPAFAGWRRFFRLIAAAWILAFAGMTMGGAEEGRRGADRSAPLEEQPLGKGARQRGDRKYIAGPAVCVANRGPFWALPKTGDDPAG